MPMIDLDYYEDKYEKNFNKQYTSDKLHEIGEWSFHPRYQRSSGRSWKTNRKTKHQFRLPNTFAPSERRDKTKEHWRSKGIHSNYRGHASAPRHSWEFSPKEYDQRQRSRIVNMIFTAEQGQWICKDYCTQRDTGDNNYYRIDKVEWFKGIKVEGQWMNISDLVREGFDYGLFNYITVYKSYFDGKDYIHAHKTFERAA
jgi:hypothetical protein